MIEKPEVHTDSDFPGHKDLWCTLVLLKIDAKRGPLYFIVEGLGTWSEDYPKDPSEQGRYFYEEHTCPTNFVRGDIVAVYEVGNRDPHGVFDFVRAVWMPQRYLDAKDESNKRGHNMGLEPKDVLEELFPELVEGHSRRCIHQGKITPSPQSESSFVIEMDGGASTLTAGGAYTYAHYVAPGETCNHPDRIRR